MSWIRLDDDFAAHRKVRRLTDSAFRLHVSALCWSAKYLTDGYVAPDDLRYIGADLDNDMDPTTVDRAAKELVDHGLWHEADHTCAPCPTSQNGWVIHDFLDLNPSGEQVRAQRAQAAERQRRARDRRRNTQSDDVDDATNGMSRRDTRVSHAGSHGEVTAGVTRQSQRPTPTPTPTPLTSLLTTFEETSEPLRGPDSESTNQATKPRRTAKRSSDQADPEFERWWTTYPRHDAKGAARKAWAKAVTKAGSVEILIAGAERYRNASTRDTDFTKLGSTWLNAECWADAGTAPSPNPQRTNGHQPYRDTGRSRDDYLGDL